MLAIAYRRSQSTVLSGLAGLGLGAVVAVLLCLPFWTGTLDYMFRQLTRAAGHLPDWWKYFSRNCNHNDRKFGE